jgi:hypothetical protein
MVFRKYICLTKARTFYVFLRNFLGLSKEFGAGGIQNTLE